MSKRKKRKELLIHATSEIRKWPTDTEIRLRLVSALLTRTCPRGAIEALTQTEHGQQLINFIRTGLLSGIDTPPIAGEPADCHPSMHFKA
jgi:hypothetical protein